MGANEVELGSSRVIRRHEQIRLVFIRGIRRRRLSGSGQSLEVELVRVPFAMHFAHDVLVVVVTVDYARMKREQSATAATKASLDSTRLLVSGRIESRNIPITGLS